MNVKNLEDGTKSVEIAREITYYRDQNNRTKPLKEEQSVLGELVTFDSVTVVKTYSFDAEKQVLVGEGDQVEIKDRIAAGSFTNNVFYIDMARLLLLFLFLFICYLVFIATKQREKEGRIS